MHDFRISMFYCHHALAWESHNSPVFMSKYPQPIEYNDFHGDNYIPLMTTSGYTLEDELNQFLRDAGTTMVIDGEFLYGSESELPLLLLKHPGLGDIIWAMREKFPVENT